MEFDKPFIYLMLRVVLGVMFFFQAYDKIFRIRLKNVYKEVCLGCRQKGLPDWFSKASVFASSYIELVGGFLLVIGLFTLPVFYLFGLHLMMLFIAFGYLQGVWDMKHVFPRFITLVILFMLPHEWNILSLDYLVFW